MKKRLMYDLKKPCKDCPFLMGSELHQGIGKSLPDYHANMEKDIFAQTCHKTDPRTDSPEGQRFKGNPRMCAGAMAMMAQGGLTAQSHVVIKLKKENWFRLKETKGTFKNWIHMVGIYYLWIRDGYPAGKTALDYEKDSSLKT